MAQTKFLQHVVELDFIEDGQRKGAKQVIQNLKETVSSEQVLALGALFSEMLPETVTLQELVTIKRTRHSEDL